jgi:hypothetical protein
VDDALHFCTSAASRKGRNLARDGRCTVGIDSDDLHVIVEGIAMPVADLSVLERVAEAFRTKYGWEPTVRDGALHATGAPTAGPPPHNVYAIRPSIVFGLGTDDTFGATRWRFSNER